MSDTLDEKLKSLELSGTRHTYANHIGTFWTLSDESVEQIKQVIGQDFYDRFAADLHRLRMDEEYQKLHKAESVDWYYSSHYLQAARRAAGLDTEGE